MEFLSRNFTLSRAEIIARIGYFRNQKHWSAYALGLELGHSKTYFYRIESGEIQLTIELLLRILEILGVSTFEFFYPDLEQFDQDLADWQLLKKMTPAERRAVTTLLQGRNPE